MIKDNIYTYYMFGYNYYLLRHRYNDYDYGDTILALKDYNKFLDVNSLKVTIAQVSYKISAMISDFEKRKLEK